jgi:hypothetical protein
MMTSPLIYTFLLAATVVGDALVNVKFAVVALKHGETVNRDAGATA